MSKPDPHHPGPGYYPQAGPDGIYRPLPSHPHLPPIVRPGGNGRWKWVVIPIGVLLVIGIIAAAAGSGGGGDDDSDASPTTVTEAPAAETDPADPAAPAAAPTEEKKKVDNDVVLYEVFGNAGEANSITYSKDEDFGIQQATNAPLPWSATVEIEESEFLPISLLAQSGSGANDSTISCRITRGDEVEVENTSTGPYAVVSCSDN